MDALETATVSVSLWVSLVVEEIDGVFNKLETLCNNLVNEYINIREAKVKTDPLPWQTTVTAKVVNRRCRFLKK